MSPSPTVISFESVSKAHGGLRALDGVSLAVHDREFLAIVGPSGSGKTTLLRLVNRLTEASEGVVRVEGEDVRSVDPIGLRRRIGYVFQNIGLFPHMTVAENIAITPRLLGLGHDAHRGARRRAASASCGSIAAGTATAFPTSSRAASVSASASRAHSPRDRGSC